MRTILVPSTLAAGAALAGAASLRGEGVEEVGNGIERFPSEDDFHHVRVDRSRFLEDEARGIAGDDFGIWPDEVAVGNVFVEERQGEDEEYQTYLGADEEDLMADFVDWWIDRDQVGNAVEYGDGIENSTMKEYSPVQLVGTDLMGEAIVDQFNRREASCGCDDGRSEVKIIFQTDFYGYETKWQLIKAEGNEVIDQGPPPNTNYADKTFYSGRWCLSPGFYKFRMIDNGNDGICSDNPAYGCGSLMLFHDCKLAGRMVNDASNWRTKDFSVLVGVKPRKEDRDLDDSIPTNINFPWCKKVRSVMEVPQGTCTLTNGRPGHRVRVTTKVDKYGKETSWQITRKPENIVMMEMGPVIESGKQKSYVDCLPPGEYNLRFKDMDGICCAHGQGFFKLVVDGKELLEGGRFAKSIDHGFQLGFDWIASMTDRDCEWWYAHDRRRRDWHTRCYPGQYCNKPYRHLKWSPALKADAKAYAEKLLDTCAVNGIEHDPDTDQGENISKNRGSGRWGELYPADNVTKRFVDNEEFWGWSRNSHLTQAIWYPTRYMGCAESFKLMEGTRKKCRMQVCRYAKPGNCQMSKYKSENGNNWMTPMMMDDSPCKPICASRDGCYN